MPERTSYPNGVPSWVDLASPDVDGSVAFYSGLFGWDYAPAGPPEETGGYGMFTLRDKLVAGIGPLQNPTQPPVWSTYIAVDDADATAAKATDAGGQVAMPPMDVMDAGRMAFLIDPVGAFVGLWQAGRHTGAQLVNEPGALGWNELVCREPKKASAFYASVFGWEPAVVHMSGHDYTVLNLDGKAIGGLMTMTDQWPEGIPSHWMAYFVVADADSSALRAQELGGTVAVGPTDVAGAGRIVMISDPSETMFSIITPSGTPD
jgi:predicted enzyme related to lactoylglutathione lyase